MSTATLDPDEEPTPDPLEEFRLDRIADLLATGRTSWTSNDLMIEVDYTREP